MSRHPCWPLCALAMVCWLPTLAVAQSASRGQQLVESRCFACHSLDANRVGPALGTVVGRRVGTATGYAYSKALSAGAFVWDAAHIKAWLTNPEALLPGQNMNYRLESAQDRNDVVAYLEALSVALGTSPATSKP